MHFSNHDLGVLPQEEFGKISCQQTDEARSNQKKLWKGDNFQKITDFSFVVQGAEPLEARPKGDGGWETGRREHQCSLTVQFFVPVQERVPTRSRFNLYQHFICYVPFKARSKGNSKGIQEPKRGARAA